MSISREKFFRRVVENYLDAPRNSIKMSVLNKEFSVMQSGWKIERENQENIKILKLEKSREEFWSGWEKKQVEVAGVNCILFFTSSEFSCSYAISAYEIVDRSSIIGGICPV